MRKLEQAEDAAAVLVRHVKHALAEGGVAQERDGLELLFGYAIDAASVIRIQLEDFRHFPIVEIGHHLKQW